MEPELKNSEKNYSERGFWNKIKNMPSGVLQKVVYLALLLYNMLTDPDVPLKTKGLIISALGYFILPFDAIPDLLSGIGYTDDITVFLLVLKQLDNYLTPENKLKALKTMEGLGIISKAQESAENQ